MPLLKKENQIKYLQSILVVLKLDHTLKLFKNFFISGPDISGEHISIEPMHSRHFVLPNQMPLRDATHSGRKKKKLSRSKHETRKLTVTVLIFTKELHCIIEKSKFTMVTASSHTTFIPNKGICRG